MCGLTGYLGNSPPNNAIALLQRMGDTIAHRGLDNSGIWYDADSGIGLAHRRLSIDKWLRHELRDWAESLLNESRLRHEGFFHPEPIRKKWAEHLSGQRNWQYHLWDILMFQAWLEQQTQ